MNRIESTIKKLQESNKKALVGYFMGGEFGIQETTSIMQESVYAGLDILELGFPFSDPTADGETIQKSAKASLINGTTISHIFNIASTFRKSNQSSPVILMGYFNIVFQYGIENFAKECQKSGIDGIIIVDLPLEESQEFRTIFERYNIFLIQIVSFLTSPERFFEIQSHAKGFIYLVSTLGVTGKAKPMVERIADYTKAVKPSVPLFVGFGISSSSDAQLIAPYCDGVIIGSHFIKAMRHGGLKELTKSIKEIKTAL